MLAWSRPTMQLRGGMSELLRQAARMQRKVEEVKAKLKDREVSGTAAGGKVTVTVTCEGKVRRIDVDPQMLAAEGVEMVLDAIVGASNAALEAADKLVEGEVSKVTGGVKMPGLGA
jgi:DNA-binding YbaB/EbfC family protein